MALTKKQMQAAHIVRRLKLDPTPPPAEFKFSAKERRAGENVLKKYSLSYSARFTVTAPEVDDDIAGILKVDAGHIATNPAYRLAIFKKR